MDEEVKNFFNHDSRYHTLDEVIKKLRIKGEEEVNNLKMVLKKLLEEGEILYVSKKGYKNFSKNNGLAVGKIQINKSGNGFVQTKDGYKIFIENCNLNGALNLDTVIVTSITVDKNNEFKGEIKEVIKRNTGDVIFEVINSDGIISLIPYNEYQNISIDINKNELKNLIDGELVIVNVGTNHYNFSYAATIKEIIGHKSDPNIDIKLLATKYNIPIDFSAEALEEAKNISNEVLDDDLIGRVDLRDKNIITIDCDDTKDRDDSVFVEKLPNGNYRLITSIASVNYYIKRDSKLFEEALKRCNSHYPNNTCIPLFPHKISNGICSLNPNVDRLTKTVETEINPFGDVVNVKIYNSVINSKKAMKYSEVNEVLDNKPVDGYERFTEDLKLMEELSNILDNKRVERNSLDFDIPDTKIIQDTNKNPIAFKNSSQGKAERIIENFMIITNTAVANYYSWLPFIFRIHEEPDTDTVNETLDLLRKSGFSFPKVKNINERTLHSIINNIKTIDEANIIKETLLKSMKRARYDTNNCGHFALQLEEYCHFTSPIRRVTDFIIHTIIDELEKYGIDNYDVSKLETELSMISKNASDVEKITKDMEYDAIKMAMAEYMENNIGKKYDAYITQIYRYGMLIKTDNLILGKVGFEDMQGDNYYYDKEKKAIIGRKSKKKYQIGNKVCVIAKEASKANCSIKFEIPNQKNLVYIKTKNK